MLQYEWRPGQALGQTIANLDIEGADENNLFVSPIDNNQRKTQPFLLF
jgi:hypothetical protein